MNSINQSVYTISSRCYNGKLVACQVLSLGYIIRHFPEQEPVFTLFLNNVTVPPCDTSSSTPFATTVQNCPYTSDPEYILACQLYGELESIKTAENLSSSTQSSQTFSTQAVECLYLSNPTSSKLLCELWCQLQSFQSKICSTASTTQISTKREECPYDLFTNSEILCDLWTQIQEAESFQTTLQSSVGSTLSGQTSTEAVGVPYISCPFRNITDGYLACSLWCDLGEMVNGTVCTEEPECPFENYTSPHNKELCLLWSENVDLKNQIF